jgi:hypothetical protein
MQPIRGSGLKRFGVAPLFRPEEGVTVIEPAGNEPGWWAGAPSALYDEESARFYLYYRIRRPRGIAPDRGGQCFIAESGNGRTFKTIWSATKDKFETESMERAALVKGLDGVWRLHLGYVDPQSRKWRIDSMEASSPDGFDPQTCKPLLDPDDLHIEGIKDPYVLTLGGQYYMIASYATRGGPLSTSQEKTLHATADAYNTGLIKSRTGLATSADGRHFTWHGDIFSPPDSGWDAYCTRICSVVYSCPVFTGFYDGTGDVWGNYEERTGIAVSMDLRHWERVSTAGPALVSAHASGCLRYMDAVQLPDRIHYYYEYARADGSHETRLNVVRV